MHGIETMPPLVCRGVLLDVRRRAWHGRSEPASGHRRRPRRGRRAGPGVEVRPGDASSSAPAGPVTGAIAARSSALETACPGPDESAARWLAERRVALTGGETSPTSRSRRGRVTRCCPCMSCSWSSTGSTSSRCSTSSDLAAAGVHEFLFVARAAKIVGATGSPVRPLAASSRDEPDRWSSRSANSPCAAASEDPPERPRPTSSGACSTWSATRSPRQRRSAASPCDRRRSRWGGASEATAIGGQARCPAPAAALVNGTLAHALDFDDTHLPSVLHPSASVVPAALAVAEARGRSGAEALDAIAVGTRSTCGWAPRVTTRARANSLLRARPARHLHLRRACRRGDRCVAARARRCEGIADAIGIAASMGAGLLEANRTGGSVKRVHCGWAAHAGVCAAELARHGLTGPPTVLEGRFGFFQAYCGDAVTTETLVAGLGEDWEVRGLLQAVSVQPLHAPRDRRGAAAPQRGPGARRDRGDRARGADGGPAHDRRALRGEDPPTLRVPRAVQRPVHRRRGAARRWRSRPLPRRLHGRAGRDTQLLELAARVRCVPDEECDRIFPQRFPARLRVRLHSRRRARMLRAARVEAARSSRCPTMSSDGSSS